MAFNVYLSNSTNTLAGALTEQLFQNPVDPFQKETIVVHSRGMERYLALYFANHMGISAGIDFVFPSKIPTLLFQKIEGREAPPFPFDEYSLRWKIYSILDDVSEEIGFEPVRRHLDSASSDRRDLRRYELSTIIERLFDRYALQRIDQIESWSHRRTVTDLPDESWQMGLWNRLFEGSPELNPVLRYRKLVERLSNSKSAEEVLPPSIAHRISFFGISTLPILYRDLFLRLSERVDLHFYYLSPCDFMQSAKLPARSEPHPLIDFYGESGTEFSGYLKRVALDKRNAVLPIFETPESPGTALEHLRAAILRKSTETDRAPVPIEARDTSIQIQSCHSPMREVEVLHDHLLRFFEKHPDAGPADALIMVREIERYSPLIRAVFGESEALPYSIADRLQDEDALFYDLLTALFVFAKSRFSVTDVFDLLENPLIRARFGIGEDTIDLLAGCVAEASIRWGFDGNFKKSLFGLPPTEQNTWRRGIDRLILGSLMTGDHVFEGIRPVEKIEGGDLDPFASFTEFIDALGNCHAFMNGMHTFPEWSAALSRYLLIDFSGSNAKRSDRLINVLMRLEGIPAGDTPVRADVVERELSGFYGDSRKGNGFLSGGVTFSEIMPMRSVPASFIGFLGLNEESFPTRDSGPSFDLILKEPLPSDRFIRKDDRQLFLESILLARRTLYLSYIGKNIQTNRRIEPSPVVSELLDHLRRNFLCGGRPFAPVTEHHLHGFHSAYFQKNGRHFSYSRPLYRASVAAYGVRREPEPFQGRDLLHSDAGSEVSFQELIGFLGNPSRFFLNTLSIRPTRAGAEGEDTENLSVGSLESYQIAEMFEKMAFDRGMAPDGVERLIRSADLLPHGELEETALTIIREKYEDYWKLVDRLKGDGCITKSQLSSDIYIDKLNLMYTARFSVPTAGGVIHLFRPAKIKSRDRLRGWLIHLTVNAAGEYPEGFETRIYGVEGSQLSCGSFRKIERGEAQGHLVDLIELFLKGSLKPIPLFPSASYEYVMKLKHPSRNHKTDPVADALGAAERRWRDEYGYTGGDSEEESIRICFRDRDPFGTSANRDLLEEFQETAMRVYSPLMDRFTECVVEP